MIKIEGKNAVAEILNSDYKILKIALLKADDLLSIKEIASQKKIPCSFVDRRFLDNESVTGHHQGVIAYINDYKYYEVDDMLAAAENAGHKPFLVIVDEVADPQNLGSIIRTSECAGVDGIIISKNRSCKINETVIRVSTGAAFNVKIAEVTNINETVKYLKEKDVFVYALEADGQNIYDTDLTTGVALIVGSEGFGVNRLTKKLSDAVVSLKMFGKINSLNASVAGGIGIYEVVRQRTEEHGGK